MLETYVILPLNKYDALQEQAHPTPPSTQEESRIPLETESKNTVTSSEAAEGSEAFLSEDSEAEVLAPEEDTERIPSTTKQLIKDKKLRETYFQKCLKVLENSGIGQLHLPNLKELVHSACSRNNRKVLANESTFYAFIIDHGLM